MNQPPLSETPLITSMTIDSSRAWNALKSEWHEDDRRLVTFTRQDAIDTPIFCETAMVLKIQDQPAPDRIDLIKRYRNIGGIPRV